MQAILDTQKWLQEIVIDHNFCPFARKVWLEDRIEWHACSGSSEPQLLRHFSEILQRLDAKPDAETAIIVLDDGYEDFFHYLGLIERAEHIVDAAGFRGIFQLASFHPQYCFADAEPNDASNFTNRSPWPLLHILREDSVAAGLDAHPQPDQIPEDNIRRCRQLGLDYFQQWFRENKFKDNAKDKAEDKAN